MLTAGDELSRTQRGNNNAYCQDNEVSWIDWSLDPNGQALTRFTARLLLLRRKFPHFRRSSFFDGTPRLGGKDVTWRTTDGRDMSDADWSDPNRRHLVAWIRDLHQAEEMLLALNASSETRELVLPEESDRGPWRVLVDTSRDEGEESTAKRLTIEAHSLLLLVRVGIAEGNPQ